MKEKTASLSLLRAIACFGVVLLHCAYACAAPFAESSKEYIAVMGLRNCVMCSVPVFVMVSGALLLQPEREISLSKIFKKYVLRMVLTLLVFSLLFYLVDMYLGVAKKPLDALLAVYTGEGWSHIWYLYLMIGIYLLLPFYRMIAKNSGSKELLYLISVYFVFLCLIPLINGVTATKAGFYICTYTVYPLYLFLGYALREKVLKIKPWLSVLLIALGSALIVLGCRYAYGCNVPALKSLLSSYAFLPVVMQAVGVFALADSLRMKEGKLLRFMDGNSFGVYLIHMVFLKYLFVALGFNPMAKGGMAEVLLLSVAVYLLSAVCTWILRKLPIFRKVL